jgi:hypothetical protein
MASATASDVISKALQRLNLISEVETMSSEQAADGLIALNEMMHGFSSQGIAYAHSDLALTDTVNMHDGLIDSLKWMLARKLADDGYGVVLSPQQLGMMMMAKRALQAAYFLRRVAPVDRALRSRGVGGYNFTRDN